MLYMLQLSIINATSSRDVPFIDCAKNVITITIIIIIIRFC